MGEFRDKYTNSTNISDILFFVYVKNSPIILGNVGDSWKKWGKKPIPCSRSFSVALSQTTNFILKEYADNNFKLDENGRKFYKTDRKHCGKRRNCSLQAISPFPEVFSIDLYCRHVKTRACLGKGYPN